MANTPLSATELTRVAQEMRTWIIDMIFEAKSGHPGGSLSAIDLITALWMNEMKGNDARTPALDRDRFVLSKGHGVPALYAVLAKLGYIPQAELKTLRRTGARLQGHPDRVRMPIVEASTGSLGQGLSVALGMAMTFRLDQSPARVFCLLGDGEIQEGQIWEAALAAPKFKLGNLVAILDYNGGQIDGFVKDVMPLEPLADKWRAFGWDVYEVDGHDMTAILATFQKIRDSGPTDRPHFVIARTVKGKGVSFMENKIEWHGVAPKADEAKRAIDEILGKTNGRAQ